jgi:hypothetical protein
VQVIVFNDGDRSLGVVVDQILDVAEDAVTVRQKTGRKGLLGSAVVGKRWRISSISTTSFERLPRVGFSARRVRERQENLARRSLGVLARIDPERTGHGRLPGAGGRESG